MSRIVLPIEKKPLFISRYESAVYFSVIQAQGKQILPWLACQLVNYHCSTDFVWRFDTIKNMSWYADKNVFFRKRYLYDRHIPGWDRNEIQAMLLRALGQQQYIHAKLNPFYIPEDESYQCFSRDTEALVYGYDSKQKVFSFLRFFPDSGIAECCAASDDFMNALCGKEDGKTEFDFLKFNDQFEFCPDYRELYNGLYDFLHSTRQNNLLIPPDRVYQGIESLKKFRAYLVQVGMYYEHIDRKYVTSFYDFQVAMDIRYRYLRQSGIMISDRYDTSIPELKKTADQFLFHCEQYNKSKDKNLLKDVVAQFDRLVDWDIGFSTEMFECLRNHMEHLGD